MITFDPVTPAPLATRIARVVLPLLTCFGYLAFRAYPAAQGRIPLGEAVVMGLVIMGLAMVACIALGDLIYPATPRARRRPSSEDLEITAVHAPITDVDTVIARSCAEEIARLDALIAYAGEDARATAGLFHDTGWTAEGVTATLDYADLALMFPERYPDGAGHIVGTIPTEGAGARTPFVELEDTQPYNLFTHEFRPQHHTPPGGFPLADLDDMGSRTLMSWDPAADGQQVIAVTPEGRVYPVGKVEIVDNTGRHHRDED